MAERALEGRVTGRHQPARRWFVKLAWLAAPLALAGELGHQLLERLGQVLAHHFFHIVFGLGAAAVFAAYVLVDIRRNGRPTFSWRIRAPRDGEPITRA